MKKIIIAPVLKSFDASLTSLSPPFSIPAKCRNLGEILYKARRLEVISDFRCIYKVGRPFICLPTLPCILAKLVPALKREQLFKLEKDIARKTMKSFTNSMYKHRRLHINFVRSTSHQKKRSSKNVPNKIHRGLGTLLQRPAGGRVCGSEPVPPSRPEHYDVNAN